MVSIKINAIDFTKLAIPDLAHAIPLYYDPIILQSLEFERYFKKVAMVLLVHDSLLICLFIVS